MKKLITKNKFFEMLKEEWRFETKSMQMVKKQISRLLIKYGSFLNQKHYKELLDKIEVEMISKYEKYYEMSVEEYNFQKYIENELGKDM